MIFQHLQLQKVHKSFNNKSIKLKTKEVKVTLLKMLTKIRIKIFKNSKEMKDKRIHTTQSHSPQTVNLPYKINNQIKIIPPQKFSTL